MSNEATAQPMASGRRLASVYARVLGASICFGAIVVILGGLAVQTSNRAGVLAISMYDHAFMGLSYADQAQALLLQLEAAERTPGASLEDASGRARVQRVLDRLDVALNHAMPDQTRTLGRRALALVAALPAASDVAAKIAEADRAITALVTKCSADGLEARDAAEALSDHQRRVMLIEISVALLSALCLGWSLCRTLAHPLGRLAYGLGRIASGESDERMPPALMFRHDEIGEIARAAEIFRDAMRQNAQAPDERERLREAGEAEKVAALRAAADSIERETTAVAVKSAGTGSALAGRAQQLAASATRVLVSATTVAEASVVALQRTELMASASAELSASALDIATQISRTVAEIANTVAAGEQARKIIGALSEAVSEIDSVAKLIGDIATRTNLIALNATIEAARAGDAGRGFAVVANEVKALATQTARSTEEITRNAGAIQRATQEAVAVVADMVRRVVAIEAIADSVARAADQQTAATHEIAGNVSGAAKAIRTVSSQVGAVTDEARETSSAVAEMHKVAKAVTENIDELRLVMVRIVRSSSEEADRRADRRLALNAPAHLVAGGEILSATCIDLNRGGARVQTVRVLNAGETVILRLPDLPDLPGTLLLTGAVTSIRFDWQPETAPAPLQAFLRNRPIAA